MNQRKSTFKVSPQKRPVTQRLTPLAWVFIGILGLALVVGCTACTLALVDRPTDEPWDPTATATTAPTETPAAPAGPSPTPTVWYQDIVTPTVAATETVTASGQLPWWSDQMTENEDGDLVPPQEVSAMVEEHIIECEQMRVQHMIDTSPPDIDGFAESAPMCYFGDRLDQKLSSLEYLREGVNTIVYAEWDSCHRQVQEWSEDGLECTVGVTCSNGTFYEYDHTGELIFSEPRDQSGLILHRYRYDPTDGRWKKLELIDFIPPQ